MMKLLLAAAAVAVLAAPALAQTPDTQAQPKTMVDEAFAKHDADKDGSLSLSEVQAMQANVQQTDFDKYDTDKDRGLSKEEFGKWIEATTTPPASTPG